MEVEEATRRKNKEEREGRKGKKRGCENDRTSLRAPRISPLRLLTAAMTASLGSFTSERPPVSTRWTCTRA